MKGRVVWVVDGDTIHVRMGVRRGYAQVMTIPLNVKYQWLFLALQREARTRGRGLWGTEPISAGRTAGAGAFGQSRPL
jgi:micrococcal nuclease